MPTSAGLRAAVQAEGSIPCTPPATGTTAAHLHASVQRFVCCCSLPGMLCVGQKHTAGMLVRSAYHMPIITLGRQAQLLCCLLRSMLMYWPKLGDKAFQIAPPIFCFSLSAPNTCGFLDLVFHKADSERCHMQPGKKCHLITETRAEKYNIKNRLSNSFRAGLHRNTKHKCFTFNAR